MSSNMIETDNPPGWIIILKLIMSMIEFLLWCILMLLVTGIAVRCFNELVRQ